MCLDASGDDGRSQDRHGFRIQTRDVHAAVADHIDAVIGAQFFDPFGCRPKLAKHPTVIGEEVKAVIQLLPGQDENNDLKQELILYCKDHLASVKCTRSIDFTDELPRLPTGKLYKRKLRDQYWAD